MVCDVGQMPVPPEYRLTEMLGVMFKPHPWHGLSPGANCPEVVTAYVEIVPANTVKFETDKTSGYLRLDRPQQYSNRCPVVYGFVPQTYCGESVARRCAEFSGRVGLEGDGDPLDICVLTSEPLSHGDFIAEVVPIGGLRLIDGEEVDDKILAVLCNDLIYGSWRSIRECPAKQLQQLHHYFVTYKQSPQQDSRPCEVLGYYDREEALAVIDCSREDYRKRFGALPTLISEMVLAGR